MAGESVLARMAVIISARNAELNARLAQSETRIQRFAAHVNALAGSLGLAFGSVLVFQGLRYGIDTIADFERRMSEVRAITGAVGSEFDSLRNDALALGKSTRYTSEQVAELQVAYGRLGFSTREILAATAATLDLATATGEDLAKSADVAGSTVRGFGLDANETLRVVDVMASSFNKTALSLDNFTESMKYVAPVASAAGATVEETTALLGTLADAGLRGSMAGTSLRRIFTDMTRDGRPLQERLSELGKRGLTLADSYDEIGRIASTALLILTKNTEKTDLLTEALRNAEGEADRMARTMEDNLTGDVTKLTSAIEALVLSGSEVSPLLRGATTDLTALVNALNSADGALGKFLSNWLTIITFVPAQGLNFLAWLVGSDEDIARLDKAGDKVKEIAEHVKKAFASGDIEKYIDNLPYLNEGLATRKEIVEAIRNTQALQAAELAKQQEEEKKRQIASLQIINALEAQIKKLEQAKKEAFSVSEIASFNAQIDALKTKLESLNNRLPLSEVKKFVPFGPEEVGRAGMIGHGNEIPSIEGIDWTKQGAMDVVQSEAEAVGELEVAYADLIDIRQQEIDKMMQQAQVATQVGETIGSAFGAAIQGQQSFAQSLAQVTEQIIELFLRQSIAAMIAASIKDPSTPLPIAKIGKAAIAIGLIKSLFAGIGGSGGGPSQSSTAFGRGSRAQEFNVQVEGEISGYNIRINQVKDSYRRSRLG